MGISSSLLINMGTLSSDWLAAKKLAAKRVSHAAWRMGFNLLSAALTHCTLEWYRSIHESCIHALPSAAVWLPLDHSIQLQPKYPRSLLFRRQMHFSSPGCLTPLAVEPLPTGQLPVLQCSSCSLRWCAAMLQRFWHWQGQQVGVCEALALLQPVHQCGHLVV